MTQGRRIALLLVAMWACQPIGAQASVVCEDLRQRLASAPEITGNSPEVRRYSSAITKQNFEIRKARQDMQRLNCDGSIVVYSSNGVNACSELSTAIRRMEDNKQILMEKRTSLQGGGLNDGAARSRLIAALDTNGCNAASTEEVLRTPRPEEGPHMPRALTRVPDFATQGSISEFALHDGDIEQGQLRTMCVSTCDGSFFPISSNASPMNFRRDAQQCSQMCPGTETELYYHSLLTQESSDMISAQTGQPYRNLSKAFAYLNRNPGEKSACSCNLADYHRRALQAQKPADEVKETYSAITEIRGSVSPETTTATQAAPPVERIYDPKAEKVRRVGPSFLPAETSSIDLRHPATQGPQPIQQ